MNFSTFHSKESHKEFIECLFTALLGALRMNHIFDKDFNVGIFPIDTFIKDHNDTPTESRRYPEDMMKDIIENRDIYAFVICMKDKVLNKTMAFPILRVITSVDLVNNIFTIAGRLSALSMNIDPQSGEQRIKELN